MSEIRTLTRNGEVFYPLTHNEAVIGMNEFKETIINQVAQYKPIEITGDVTNAPDEEDLTTDSNNLLKFKDRNNLYGLGKVILRRGSSFASQVTLQNTLYVIQYNFDLNNERIILPNGAILLFEGGSVNNGTLVGNGNRLVYYQELSEIMTDLTLEGTFVYKACDKDTTGSISVDNSSIEVNGLGQLSVKANGIQNTHLNGSIVDQVGLVLDSNNKISIKADGTVSQIIGNMKGVANGIASLDSTGKVPSSQLPSSQVPDNIALLGDDDGQAVILGFDPETDTLHKAAQVLTTAEKDQVAQNLNNRPSTNGMARIELKATDNFKSVVEAQTGGNTIFVIKYDFTLTGDVTVPANCILEFNGGSISGAYTLTGSNTGINAGLVKIFNTNVTLAGTWNVVEAYLEWFGNDIASLNKALDINSTKIYTVRLSGQLSADTPILVKRPVQIISNDFAFTQTKWGYPGIVIAADNVSIIGKISVISQVATRTQPTQSDSYWPDMADAKASSSGICLGNLYNDTHAYQNIYVQHACCYNFIGGICNHGGTGVHNLIIDYLYVENVDFGLLGAGYFDTTINTIEFKDIASYVDSQDPSHAVYLTGGDTVGLSKNVIINRVVGTGLKSKGTDTVLSIKSTLNFRLLSANVSNIYGFCDAIKSNGIVENVFVDESYGYLVGSQLESDFVIKRIKATNVVGKERLIWNSGYGNISIEDSIISMASEVAGGDNCLCYCSDGSLSLKNVDFNTIEGSVFALVGTRGSANVYIYDIKASIQIQKTLSGDPNVKTFLNPDKLNPANACGDSLLRLFNVILPNKTIYTDGNSNLISAGVCDKIQTTSNEVRRIYAAYGNIITLINNGSTAIQSNTYIQTKTGAIIPASDWKVVQFLGDGANHVTQIG